MCVLVFNVMKWVFNPINTHLQYTVITHKNTDFNSVRVYHTDLRMAAGNFPCLHVQGTFAKIVFLDILSE